MLFTPLMCADKPLTTAVFPDQTEDSEIMVADFYTTPHPSSHKLTLTKQQHSNVQPFMKILFFLHFQHVGGLGCMAYT